MIEQVVSEVDLENPPVEPPDGCVDDFLWRLAYQHHDNHDPDPAGRCQQCGTEHPCLGRMLARDGLATALGETVDWSLYWIGFAEARR